MNPFQAEKLATVMNLSQKWVFSKLEQFERDGYLAIICADDNRHCHYYEIYDGEKMVGGGFAEGKDTLGVEDARRKANAMIDEALLK